MSAGLDMSLDDLISKAPKTGGKGKGGSRVAANRKASRPTPYGGGGGRGRGRGGSFGGGRGGGGGIALKSTGANSVYVGNLSWDVTWQDLKDHMKQAGDVVHADVMYEPGSTRSKGCGVVSFANAKGAATAIATLTDTDLKGRMIFVREDREAGNGGGGGGGGAIGAKAGQHSVYVGNLSWDVTWQDLKDHFKQVGQVAHADVMLENGSTRSKGCGIVTFNNAKDAANAIATMTDTDLKGRMIFVREDREAGNGGGGGGGFAGGKGGGGGGDQAGCKLYVGNLSWEMAWHDLKDLFKQAGNVVHADVMMGDDGRSKGFGTVVMGSTTDAAAAIQLLNEAEHLGRNLIVRPDAHA